MLPAERNPPIEEVISQGVIPRFVQFLQRTDVPALQVRLLSEFGGWLEWAALRSSWQC